MGPSSLWRDALNYLCGLPVMFAYRIVWAMALTGNGNARDVYRAMWDANLDLPPIKKLTSDQETALSQQEGSKAS